MIGHCKSENVIVETISSEIFQREGDREWTEFAALKSNNPKLIPRSNPKPDQTYAFQILTFSDARARGLERDDFVQSFSAPSLGKLLQRNIISAPTTGLRKWCKSPQELLDNRDAACFPWAIVEHKRDINLTEPSVQEESFQKTCYCQAANASAAALEMRARLYAHVFDQDYSKLPPIISFTCVGPIVRLWLTYYPEKDTNKRVSASSIRYCLRTNNCSKWIVYGLLR